MEKILTKFNKKLKETLLQYTNGFQKLINKDYGIINYSFPLNFNFLKKFDIIYSNEIIKQQIFKKSEFIGLFELFHKITDVQICSCECILSQLSHNFNNIEKSIKHRKNLVIFKLDFNNKEEYIRKWVKLLKQSEANKQYTQQQIQQFIISEQSGLIQFFENHIYQKNIVGGIYSSNQINSVMFINIKQENEDIICHQMIHYFQDITERSIPKNIFFSSNFKTYDLIENLELIPAIFNARQIIPYARNIAYIFQRHRS